MNNNDPGILHCDQCTKTSLDFQTRSNFFRHVRHVRSHGKEEKCDKCLKVFGSKIDLVNHLNMVHIEKEYECQECQVIKKFRWKKI